IVSYDSAVTDATIPEYLDDHFKGQLGLPGDSSRRVLPVTVLSSLEIEVLEGLCVRYPLHEVIQRFHRQPNSGEPLSFWHFLTSNYGQMLTPDGTLVGETFKAIHERMLGLFEARAGELPTTSEGG
ncbi:MAG TPA: hypothetical protein VFJ58_17560, partial [Armatimonadota bacterium]|nr:hypothetical protein [Armatimonadota bacterium]